MKKNSLFILLVCVFSLSFLASCGGGGGGGGGGGSSGGIATTAGISLNGSTWVTSDNKSRLSFTSSSKVKKGSGVGDGNFTETEHDYVYAPVIKKVYITDGTVKEGTISGNTLNWDSKDYIRQ